ncbi:MAG: glycosyltransferase family 4 protein [Candidatus Hydrogenedentota bacterium]
MRVLICLTEPYDSAITYYGLCIAKILKKYNIDFAIITLKDKYPETIAKQAGYSIINLDFRTYNPIRYFKETRKLYTHLKDKEKNIVILLRAEMTLALYLLSRFTAVRFKTIRVRGEARDIRKNYINKKLYTKFYDRVVFTSKIMQTRHISIIPTPFVNSCVIYSPVDTDYYNKVNDLKNIRGIYGLKDDEKLITIYGRLDPVKGHQYFIEAMNKVFREYKGGLKVAVIGREENVKIHDLKKGCEKYGIIDKFIFTGHIDNPLPLLSITDIGVISSIGSETVCRVAVELLSLSIPLVSTDAGVLPEVVKNNETGFVVHQKDTDAMKDKILELLDNDELRKNMEEKARRDAVLRFSINVFEKEWMELLDSLL